MFLFQLQQRKALLKLRQHIKDNSPSWQRGTGSNTTGLTPIWEQRSMLELKLAYI